MSSTTPTSIDDAACSAATKTVYFIRHAESEENRRLGSMKTALRDVSKFTLPKTSDITDGLSWFNIPAQLDSDVSEVGKEQIAEMAGVLQKANFLQDRGIELIAHSPLVRAKETCKGILGCAAPDLVVDPVQRVVELGLLEEKTVPEWTISYATFEKRLKDFQKWLQEQNEDNIVLVGHSQYFRALLGLDFKFGNCDVWKSTFHVAPSSGESKLGSQWSGLEKLYVCEATPSRTGGKGEVSETK